MESFFVFRKKPEPPIWWVEPACCHAEQQLALWSTDYFSRYLPGSILCLVLCVTCCQHQERLEQKVFSTVESNKCFAGRGGGTSLCPASLCPVGSWRRDDAVVAMGMPGVIPYAPPTLCSAPLLVPSNSSGLLWKPSVSLKACGSL